MIHTLNENQRLVTHPWQEGQDMEPVEAELGSLPKHHFALERQEGRLGLFQALERRNVDPGGLDQAEGLARVERRGSSHVLRRSRPSRQSGCTRPQR